MLMLRHRTRIKNCYNKLRQQCASGPCESCLFSNACEHAARWGSAGQTTGHVFHLAQSLGVKQFSNSGFLVRGKRSLAGLRRHPGSQRPICVAMTGPCRPDTSRACRRRAQWARNLVKAAKTLGMLRPPESLNSAQIWRMTPSMDSSFSEQSIGGVGVLRSIRALFTAFAGFFPVRCSQSG